MNDVVLLSLVDSEAGGCGSCAGSCGDRPESATPRVPVLACRDALVAGGARVNTVSACSDAEIDAALDRLPDARLVVAVTDDGQLRAVMRRMVRRYAPPPSKRPADLAPGRTLPDLPAIGILPLDPQTPGAAAGLGGRTGPDDLAARLGLARDPAAVAAAVLGGRTRRLDLLRNDGGSVTLHGALFSGAKQGFSARVEVDDTVLSTGDESLIAAAVANAGGYATINGLPLAVDTDATDGVLDVAVAVPVVTRRLFRADQVRVEVRRARGRAVAVSPRADVSYLDDGVRGTLARKRSWWMEHGAWGVYVA